MNFLIFILTIHLWITKNCANGIELRENRTLIDFPKVMHNFFYKNDLMNGSENNILNKNSYLDYKNIYKLRFNPNENDFVKNTKLSEVIENVVTVCEEEILEQVTTELPVNNKIEKNIMKPNSLNFLTPQIKSFLNFNKSESLPTNGSKRFLNLFNIIKFQNGPCFTTNILYGQMNGTCFHKMECDQLGGLSFNSCANGFGVCCVCKILCICLMIFFLIINF